MTRSIRGRLQWWYGMVYAISIIVFGGLVYWRADRDVNERAVLQAVSTAQYLDVSLRNVRPRWMRPSANATGDELAANVSSDPFPEDFFLGPLPPEFQFRPPRPFPPGERGSHERPLENRSPPDRSPQNRLPPDRSPDDLLQTGRPQGPSFRGPLDAVQPSGAPEDESEFPRPRVDRMEFVVWRADGSVLTQSDGSRASEFAEMPMPVIRSPAPQVDRSGGLLNVTLRGPHASTILVLRPMDHDLSGLRRFGLQIAAMALVTSVVGIAGGWWISGRMVKPIQRISETASRMSATSLNQRIETQDLDTELVELATVLNTTFCRLEESFGRLTQFTADASHELRTPLAVIQSQVELALSQTRTPEAYQQTLATCLRSSERMRLLVDGLLLLARTDSDRLELRPEQLDLRDIAEEAMLQLQSKADAAGIELVSSFSADPVWVSADPRFLPQIPANLIDNAIQHTPSGGKIFIDVRLVDGLAVFKVTDTGCGMTAEHLPRIFERFYRADTARSRQNGGCGLGLAICRSLADAHGGSVECTSEVGKGSVFTVKWPSVETTKVDGTPP